MKCKNKILVRIIFVWLIIIIILLLLCRCSQKKDGGKIHYSDPKEIEIKDNDKDKNIDNNNDKKNIDDKNNIEKVNKDIDIVPSDSKPNKISNMNTNNKPSSSNINNDNNNDSIVNEDNNNNDYNNDNEEDDDEDEEDENEDGELVVDWEHNSQLEIFYNTYFNDVKIAPSVRGNYSFEIKNSRGKKIKYNISLSDNNDYNINMKYRLKKGNKYVVGNYNSWVTVNELVYYNQKLKKGETNIYTLEWIWEDSDNDTTIGQTVGANYSLAIRVYGEDING